MKAKKAHQSDPKALLKCPNGVPRTQSAIFLSANDGQASSTGVPGWVYGYTFPAYERDKRHDGRFRIKVGMTTLEDTPQQAAVETRVKQQVGTSNAETPRILLTQRCHDAKREEARIHACLKHKGLHVKDVPGKEWFFTTLGELKELVSGAPPENAHLSPREDQDLAQAIQASLRDDSRVPFAKELEQVLSSSLHIAICRDLLGHT